MVKSQISKWSRNHQIHYGHYICSGKTYTSCISGAGHFPYNYRSLEKKQPLFFIPRIRARSIQSNKICKFVIDNKYLKILASTKNYLTQLCTCNILYSHALPQLYTIRRKKEKLVQTCSSYLQKAQGECTSHLFLLCLH